MFYKLTLDRIVSNASDVHRICNLKILNRGKIRRIKVTQN